MPRGIVDVEGMRSPAAQALRDMAPKPGRPFRLTKIGHVVLMVKDVERSTAFYTGVLGFRVSDVYPESMMKGRMVFMRCASDHHGVALVCRGRRGAGVSASEDSGDSINCSGSRRALDAATDDVQTRPFKKVSTAFPEAKIDQYLFHQTDDLVFEIRPDAIFAVKSLMAASQKFEKLHLGPQFRYRISEHFRGHKRI